MCEGKILVGFRLGYRATNRKSWECQACKETLNDALCSHGRPFNYGIGYEKVNSCLSVMGFFVPPCITIPSLPLSNNEPHFVPVNI